MAARKPAASTLLKQAQAQIEKLQKELEQARSLQKTYNEQRVEAQAQVDQVHALIDALPGSVGRKVAGDQNAWPPDISLNVMTRLAAWLATRN